MKNCKAISTLVVKVIYLSNTQTHKGQERDNGDGKFHMLKHLAVW